MYETLTASSFPANLPHIQALRTEFSARWYSIVVMPRHEKRVMQLLGRRDVHCFVPTYRSVRRWQDRRKELDLALFPGYAFVHLNLHDRMTVLTIPGVVRFVMFQGQPAVVDDLEISVLHSLIAACPGVAPHPYLQKGRRVRVIRGALAGTEGILVRRKEKFRLVLSVDLIMRSLAVEVEECDVEPC